MGFFILTTAIIPVASFRRLTLTQIYLLSTVKDLILKNIWLHVLGTPGMEWY